MGFYTLDKSERAALVGKINSDITEGISSGYTQQLLRYFADEDTYIRKAAYLCAGRLYASDELLRPAIIRCLEAFLSSGDAAVRQTTVNAAGEIGKLDFETVRCFFDIGLFDSHHAVRNAVIGSMKKMGEKNPAPVIAWSRGYLQHPDKEIRREICHGIELRGRTHPEDILPLLRELQNDTTKRVRWTLVHVIGQISYKKGCLEKVMADILQWENKPLVADAVAEIIDVHDRYRNFSHYTQDEARAYINNCGYTV